MKKYLALYMAPTEALNEMMKNSTPESQKAGMDAWTTWMDAHKANFTDIGNPTGKNMRVTTEGSTPTHNEVCGYSIMQAESLEEASKIFEGSPHLTMMKGGYVDVVECMPM